MTGRVDTRDVLAALAPEAVADWLASRRWYQTKSRTIASLTLEHTVSLESDSPLVLVLADVRLTTGARERYQLPLCVVSANQLHGREPIQRLDDDRFLLDAVADPELARELLRAIDDELVVDTDDGQMRFARVGAGAPLPHDHPVRPIGVEQSNSSIVFAERTVLKVFRRLEPGVNPELEMLRFLTAHGYPSIAPLQGYYEYEGSSLRATLGVAQRFHPDATGGWELALARLAADPAMLLTSLGELGQTTAELHNVLACDERDPAFAPERPSADDLTLPVIELDQQIDSVFVALADDERASALAGSGPQLRDQLAHHARLGLGGLMIRTHGDYHLGQTLRVADGWVIIDFEGEPARPLAERRRKTSPLRDVAGMLRSFAYAAHGSAETVTADAFERRAREVFLDRYLATIEPRLLPDGDAAIASLLSVFELEKVIYELRYELDNRPDWLPIPIAGIVALLQEAT